MYRDLPRRLLLMALLGMAIFLWLTAGRAIAQEPPHTCVPSAQPHCFDALVAAMGSTPCGGAGTVRACVTVLYGLGYRDDEIQLGGNGEPDGAALPPGSVRVSSVAYGGASGWISPTVYVTGGDSAQAVSRPDPVTGDPQPADAPFLSSVSDLTGRTWAQAHPATASECNGNCDASRNASAADQTALSAWLGGFTPPTPDTPEGWLKALFVAVLGFGAALTLLSAARTVKVLWGRS